VGPIETSDHLALFFRKSLLGCESVFARFAQLERTRVEWIQLSLGDGPAAVRHPGTLLKIDCVKRNAAAAPSGGCAAPLPAAIFLERFVAAFGLGKTAIKIS